MLVDDESEMRLLPLHLTQNVFEPRRIHDIHRRLKNVFEAKLLRPQQIRHQVFAMNEANHIIQRAAIHRQTRITILLKCVLDIFQRTIGRDGRNGRTGNHCLAHQRI